MGGAFLRLVRALCSLVVVGLVGAPAAEAGADVDGVVVAVTVDDHRDGPCPSGACLVSVEGDSPGNVTIDAAQRIHYLGVATQGERVEDWSGGLILLPDASVQQNGSHVYVPHPFIDLATRSWQSTEEHQPARDVAGVELNQRHHVVYYYGPAWYDPEGHDRRDLGMEYGTPNGYDRLGPFNVRRGSTTDRLVTEEWDDAACEVNVANEECDAFHARTVEPYESATPNAIVGLEFYDAKVAAHEESIRRAAGTVAAEEPSALRLRAYGDAPIPAPERRAQVPGALGLADPRPLSTSTPPGDAPAQPGSPQSTQDVLVEVTHPGPGLVDEKALALAAAAAGALLVLLGFALYSRITSPNALLRSRPRGQLYELVQSSPGICLTDATGPLGLTRNAVAHHVRMMQRARLLEVVEDEGRKLLFPVGARPRNPVQVSHGLWNHPVRGRVLRLLLEAGGSLPRQELHALLHDVPERTRNYTLARLVEKDVLSVAPDGLGVTHVRLLVDAGAAALLPPAGDQAHAT